MELDDAWEGLGERMDKDCGLEHVECCYEGIPRKIVCEEPIETEDGELPRDYKAFCSYGVPKLILVIGDRLAYGHSCLGFSRQIEGRSRSNTSVLRMAAIVPRSRRCWASC